MSCELKFNYTQKGAERREKAVIFGGKGQVETPEVDGLRAAGNPNAESERRDAVCFAGRVKEGARRKRESATRECEDRGRVAGNGRRENVGAECTPVYSPMGNRGGRRRLPWREGVRSVRGGTDAFGPRTCSARRPASEEKAHFWGKCAEAGERAVVPGLCKKLRSGPSGKAQASGTAGRQGARAACGSSVTAGAKRSPACGKFSGRVIHAAARLKGETPPGAQRCATSCSGRSSVR